MTSTQTTRRPQNSISSKGKALSTSCSLLSSSPLSVTDPPSFPRPRNLAILECGTEFKFHLRIQFDRDDSGPNVMGIGPRFGVPVMSVFADSFPQVVTERVDVEDKGFINADPLIIVPLDESFPQCCQLFVKDSALLIGRTRNNRLLIYQCRSNIY
jgi:hypothetical protein